MFVLGDKLKLIRVKLDYLKKLHDACDQVQYNELNYNRKVYMGILLNNGSSQYVIPLSSAKDAIKL